MYVLFCLQALKRDIINTLSDRCAILFEDLLINETSRKKSKKRGFPFVQLQKAHIICLILKPLWDEAQMPKKCNKSYLNGSGQLLRPAETVHSLKNPPGAT